MEYAIGLALALFVSGSATALGFDRERVFYPAILIVVAAYYVLFAAMISSGSAVIAESIAAVAFFLIAVIGFKSTLWLVVAGLAGHGLFDFVHHFIIENPGVPLWWPGFCLTADVALASYLAVLIKKRPGR
jgi:hypothetical protein